MNIQQQDCDACGESFLSYGKATRCEICKAQKADSLTAAAIVLVGEHLIRALYHLLPAPDNLAAALNKKARIVEVQNSLREAAEKLGIVIK